MTEYNRRYYEQNKERISEYRRRKRASPWGPEINIEHVVRVDGPPPVFDTI